MVENMHIQNLEAEVEKLKKVVKEQRKLLET